MQFILENLRNRKQYCTLEKLNNKGMIAKETSSENMYCTLSSAFAETPHAIEQIIRDEVVVSVLFSLLTSLKYFFEKFILNLRLP